MRSGKIISFHMFTDESWHGHEGWFRLGQVMKDGMFAKMKFTRPGLATASLPTLSMFGIVLKIFHQYCDLP